MKTLFIQLCQQDPVPEATSANVPLIAGRLAAMAIASGLYQRQDLTILDDATADHGSDAAVCSQAISLAPELIVFTLLPWNAERSAWIARRLRATLAATWCVACGPAARFEEWGQTYDCVLEGEPEACFLDMLSDASRRSLEIRYRSTVSLSLSELPDPWLSGVLSVRSDKPVLVETRRGGSLASLAGAVPSGSLGRERLAKLMSLASMQGAQEFRILDRPFDSSDLAGLKALAAANESGVPFRAKLDLSSLSDESSDLLLDAGLSFADSDLLSTNPAALQAMGRSLDKAGFERGLGMLWARDVSVRPLVLLGLPNDSYETIVSTFDFLGMAGTGQDALLRPLAVYPGSPLWQARNQLGIREFLKQAPHWVLETDWLDEDGFLDSVADFEESFDVAWSRPVPPRFLPARSGFISFIDARKDLDRAILSPEKLANSVTILADGDNPDQLKRLARAAKDLRKDNPFTLWQIVMHSDTSIPDDQQVNRLADAFSYPDHYYELCQLYSLDPQPTYQTRLFFSTHSEALALSAIRDRPTLETIFVLGEVMPHAQLVEQIPFLAYDREAIPFELVYDIISAYREFPDMLVELRDGLLDSPTRS